MLYGAARRLAQLEALELVTALWNAPIPRKCIENPQGCINTKLPFMPRPQVVQPYEFGHDASKSTCLWLDTLPPLQPTVRVPGRTVTLPSGRTAERWANQTDSGQNRLPPSADRWKIRSDTYAGMADALVTAWSKL